MVPIRVRDRRGRGKGWYQSEWETNRQKVEGEGWYQSEWETDRQTEREGW